MESRINERWWRFAEGGPHRSVHSVHDEPVPDHPLQFLAHQSTLCFFIGVLVIYSILTECGVQKAFSYARRRKRWLLPMLSAFFGQTMNLGLFSFLLFVASRYGLFEAIAPFFKEEAETVAVIAEGVHMIVFVGLVLYVVVVSSVVLGSVWLVNMWAHNETRGRHAALEEARSVRDRMRRSCLSGWWNPYWIIRRHHTSYRVKYHAIRAHSIHLWGTDDTFPFASYLKRCIGHLFKELVEIHWSVWLVMMLMTLIDWARYKIMQYAHRDSPTPISMDLNPPFWISVSTLFFLCGLILFVKCYRIFNGMSLHAERYLVKFGRMAESVNAHVQDEAATMEARVEAQLDESTALLVHQSVQLSKPRHSRLFWLQSPILLLRLIQMVLLFQAWFVAVLLVFIPQQEHRWPTYVEALCLLPPTLMTVSFAPLILPLYGICTATGVYTNKKILERTRRGDRLLASDSSDSEYEEETRGKGRKREKEYSAAAEVVNVG